MLLKDDYVYEKLGISDDVSILSEFLYNYLNHKNNENIEINKDEIPKLSFKINKIFIKFLDIGKDDENNYKAAFDYGHSKLTKEGYNLIINFNKNIILDKFQIYHEIHHIFQYQKLTSKKLGYNINYKSFDVSNKINDKKFNNLLDILYLSDDGEINAKVAEAYANIKEIINKIKIKINRELSDNEKKKIFINIIKDDYKTIYDLLISYNIKKDFKDIPDKNIIKFLNDVFNIRNILKNTNNKFIIKFRIFKSIFNDDYSFSEKQDSNYYLNKIEIFIHQQGEKLKNKIHKLWDLL